MKAGCVVELYDEPGHARRKLRPLNGFISRGFSGRRRAPEELATGSLRASTRSQAGPC